MKFLQQVDAMFAPARTDDLVPGLSDWIGRRFALQATEVIEDGPYAGQWAMMPLPPGGPAVGWIPECDLTDVVQLRPGIPA